MAKKEENEDYTPHPGGRPTKYSKEMYKKVERLFDEHEAWYDSPVTTIKANGDVQEKMVRTPNPPLLKRNIAKHLGVAWSTLCLWEKEHEEFSDLLKQRQLINEDIITENGLNGLYQGNFAAHYTKAKLGWKDKSEIDITSGGKSIWAAIRAKRESNEDD